MALARYQHAIEIGSHTLTKLADQLRLSFFRPILRNPLPWDFWYECAEDVSVERRSWSLGRTLSPASLL